MADAPLKTAEKMAIEFDEVLKQREESMRQQATDRVNKGFKKTKAKKSKGKRAKKRQK